MSKKLAIAMGIIFTLGIIIFTVPEIIGKDISLVMKVSAFILVSIYIVLSFELIHRGSLALLGATIIVGVAMILDSIPPEEGIDFIIDSVDFNTIGLLLGMMIIVAILGETGIFYWVGIKANKLSKGNLWKLMVLLCTFTAVSSMFIDNVTTILLMVPVTLSIVRTFKCISNTIHIISGISFECWRSCNFNWRPPKHHNWIRCTYRFQFVFDLHGTSYGNSISSIHVILKSILSQRT